ncbi:hypothetical protein AWB80_07562 [Caballeronia pedi]|uniref:Lipoprotein n=1 Tax=Caballeronia pedi TaxID=1777141 RepID=A0A158DVQ3_9BURK|nr:hypothetical protein [Caballeronia pedi]SAK98634.1 hypothetical protein AWB80_07562 [Caballeronia pedi]
MKRAVLAAILALASSAYAADSQWWVAQRNGICLSLGEEFPGMRTPEEAWAKMIAGVPVENRIRIKHVSSTVTTFRDAFGRFPPLVMVKGHERCQAEIEKWNNPYGY